MRYAIVIDNMVQNVVCADAPLASNWIKSDTANIGDTFDNAQFYSSTGPREYERLAQQYLDGCATELGYDNILTAISYANEPAVLKFQQDGLMLRAKRSLVWQHCYTQLALVQSGARPKPTLQEFLSELQAITNEAL